MKVKRLMAMILVSVLLLGGCAAETAEQTYGTRVDKKQILSDRFPEQNQTVSLISTDLEDFLIGYTLGKGLTVAGNGDVKLHNELTLSWKCSKKVNGYTVIYATKQDFSNAVSIKVDQPQLELSDLYVGTTYYWQVVSHTESGDNYSSVYTFQTDDTPRILTIPGVANTRDIGGYLTADVLYRVAQGKLYRGARLEDAKPEGISNALETYKIKTDLDLRSSGDRGFTGDGSPLGDAVKYINIPAVAYRSAFTAGETMYQELSVFADEQNYPIYVHCSAGRDRTGTICFIIGALLGVPEKVLCADYEITYLTSKSYGKGDQTGHDKFIGFLEQFKRLHGETLQEKAETFCKNVGITDAQIQAIRSILLEPVTE